MIVQLFQTKQSALATIVLIMLVTGLVGTYAGYDVGGIEYGYNSADPGVFGVVEWVWSSMSFLWNIISMQVTDVPPIISIFFQFLSIMSIYLIVKLIRG